MHAWAVLASPRPATPKPPDTNADAAKPTKIRFIGFPFAAVCPRPVTQRLRLAPWRILAAQLIPNTQKRAACKTAVDVPGRRLATREHLVLQLEPVEHGLQARVERSLIDSLLPRGEQMGAIEMRIVIAVDRRVRGEG